MRDKEALNDDGRAMEGHSRAMETHSRRTLTIFVTLYASL